jgi:peroxiredoxin
MDSILRRGQVVPTFTLPDTAGTPVRRTAYRDKKNLVLAFLPDAEDDGARAYLSALAPTGRRSSMRSAIWRCPSRCCTTPTARSRRAFCRPRHTPASS